MIVEKKYISIDKPEIDWRFAENEDILKSIIVLTEEFNNLLWNKLLCDNIVKDFIINKTKFEFYEEYQFRGNDNWVLERLEKLVSQNEKVILTYSSGQSFFVDIKLIIDNWSDFYYPSSDDILIINDDRNWIICISHFELFQFAQGQKK